MYSEPMTITPVLSVSSDEMPKASPRAEEDPMSLKDPAMLGISDEILSKLHEVRGPQDDSYSESLRAMTEIKKLADLHYQAFLHQKYGKGSASPVDMQTQRPSDDLSDQAIYAVAAGSMLEFIGLPASVTRVKSTLPRTPSLIAVHGNLVIDPFHKDVRSLVYYDDY